jgi:hypothetical protein
MGGTEKDARAAAVAESQMNFGGNSVVHFKAIFPIFDFHRKECEEFLCSLRPGRFFENHRLWGSTALNWGGIGGLLLSLALL